MADENAPPSSLMVTSDGTHTVVSPIFNETYHSKHGALQESMHVFIDKGLLYPAFSDISALGILELGFGTGLNALLSSLYQPQTVRSIHYTTYEAYPLDVPTALSLNYTSFFEDKPDAGEVFDKMHQCDWGQDMRISERFVFRKERKFFQDIAESVPFHLIYFDAFGPGTQPELWERPLVESLYNLLHPGGILVTYGAQGAFRRHLKSVGFAIEILPGPPGKREMTRAVK